MIFDRLRLIEETIPGSGAWNMAVDEMLLQELALPTLRVYRWAEPTVTMGYFEKLAETRGLRPGLPLMRRWTGGGLVDHGADWTYSLLIPPEHELVRGERARSYVEIHRVIRDLAARLCETQLELAEVPEGSGDGCFRRAVVGDLLIRETKVAGAAQRRTRCGLLHQGSVQRVPFDTAGAAAFAGGFASEVMPIPLTADERQRAESLVASRYGTAEWLERF
ncbi:MAG TPA: hypothetical protein VF585_01280 [Chthoniobacterales bacterium]|jgi:lipoate-protein ligase A